MGASIDIAELTRVSDADRELLARMLTDVNRIYFAGQINIPVRWEIPSASESPEPTLDISSLSRDELTQLTQAVKAYAAKRYDEAKELIIPFTVKGIRDACQLYIRILIETKDSRWHEVAKRFNKVCTDTLYVPAGSTENIDGHEHILIHPSLSRSAGLGAPRYVLRYVIFHELLHKFLGTSASTPHPTVFRLMEQVIHQRSKAISWLQRNHFSTIEDVFS